jgi:hypothetical protein
VLDRAAHPAAALAPNHRGILGSCFFRELALAAVLAEQNEWADTGRRYMSLEAIAKTLARPSPGATVEVAMIAA